VDQVHYCISSWNWQGSLRLMGLNAGLLHSIMIPWVDILLGLGLVVNRSEAMKVFVGQRQPFYRHSEHLLPQLST
jgi:hypothetical protein